VKTQPVVPADIVLDAEGLPFAPAFGDRYHPRIGALAQARHVFLAGNDLPVRWAGRERFTVLETGFGLGNNFLATWQAWRDDPARCARVDYVAVERHPPTRADLERLHRGSPLPTLAQALVDAWPPLTPGLHRLAFDAGRLRLLLAFGDAVELLPELRLAADAFFLDGFAPARNPALWQPRLLQALARRAAPGATAATWSVARELRDGLTAAGFEVERTAGIGGKREITVARFRPRFVARHAMPSPACAAREAVVVGAGLAGAFCARALADEGFAVRLLDRRNAPAAETSGNPAGLFHGTVHADDGPHARLLRAAALSAAQRLRPRIGRGVVAGGIAGLLRLDDDLDAMRAAVERQRLPADWVQALDTATASALAGVTLPGPAWFYPGGGWVAPADAVRDAIGEVPFTGGVEIQALESAGGGWRLLDADGAMIAESALVVLATAADASRLLAPLGLNDLVLQRTRGQISGWSGEAVALRMPVAGDGYAIPMPGGGLWCGATGAAHDDAAPRDADDEQNHARLRRLTGLRPPSDRSLWSSRVGWRVGSADRLPVAGAVPADESAATWRNDQPRFLPRRQGLFVCTALGGRGITLAPLLGALIAAQAAGSPWPLEQGLVDAIDPARWRVRAQRRALQR
jgi:tRNA 5-methylaminomethyl-2-thiouridine biosynthesis bifunctional protein